MDKIEGKRLIDESSGWRSTPSLTVGVVLDKKGASFFLSIGSDEPSYQILVFIYQVSLTIEHTRALRNEPDEDAHQTRTQHLQPEW